jgi:hypothetical protein
MDRSANDRGVDSGCNSDTISSPSQKKVDNEDAFIMLMSNDSSSDSRKRKRPEHNSISRNLSPNNASRFVLCPVGCGRHILFHTINDHLDACLCLSPQHQQRQKQSNEEDYSPPSLSSTLMDDDTSRTEFSSQDDSEAPSTAVRSMSTQYGTEEDESSVSITVESRLDFRLSNNNSNHDNEPSNEKNIFVHMMKQSAKVQAATKDIVQRMHLHDNGKVTTTCYSNSINHNFHGTDLMDQHQQRQHYNYHTPLGRIAWSATIQIRKTMEMDCPVTLIVSTSIPPNPISQTHDSNDRTRFVSNHSRLSVPVLKSILQKSIRRRKPLPSVRVAMELCDKSLADLLRRLSVIMLEDSSLHPDMPLLVWLMIASSKDYNIPLILMKRVFGIVYEMSSCPWRDPLTARPVATAVRRVLLSDERHFLLAPLSITSFQSHFKKHLETNPCIQLTNNDTMIWSILMRSNYGGMQGDVRMLHWYAALWMERFTQRSIPVPILAQLISSRSGTCHEEAIALEEWSQVPSYIHHTAFQKSSSRIDSLLMSANNNLPTGVSPAGLTCRGLQKLFFSDITTEGVDFHCSSILKDTILGNSSLVQSCLDFLWQINHREPIPNTEDRRLVWLENVLKSCMWNFSSGVNFRVLSLTVSANANDNGRTSSTSENDEKKILKQLWEQHILPRTKVYTEQYVKSRLAS